MNSSLQLCRKEFYFYLSVNVSKQSLKINLFVVWRRLDIEYSSDEEEDLLSDFSQRENVIKKKIADEENDLPENYTENHIEWFQLFQYRRFGKQIVGQNFTEKITHSDVFCL